jgi:ankyrin repeat protein
MPEEQAPLHFAASNGNVEVVKLLLERGAALEAQSTYVRVHSNNPRELLSFRT